MDDGSLLTTQSYSALQICIYPCIYSVCVCVFPLHTGQWEGSMWERALVTPTLSVQRLTLIIQRSEQMRANRIHRAVGWGEGGTGADSAQPCKQIGLDSQRGWWVTDIHWKQQQLDRVKVEKAGPGGGEKVPVFWLESFFFFLFFYPGFLSSSTDFLSSSWLWKLR